MAQCLQEPFAVVLRSQSRSWVWMSTGHGWACRGHTYMYGPGNSLRALKQRQVSSVNTGPPILQYQLGLSIASRCRRGLHTISAALRHLSFEISSIVPWISTRSRDWFFNGTMPSRMDWTSDSLFLLPVIKCSSLMTIL